MRRQEAALARRDTLPAVMENKIPAITIGLDLGNKKHAICVLNKADEIIEERSITNNRESLKRLSHKYPKSQIAMEFGQHSPWTSRFFEALGHDVLVANVRKLRAIYTSTGKSDQSDAYTIARLARVDPTLLHPIQHSTEQAQRDLRELLAVPDHFRILFMQGGGLAENAIVPLNLSRAGEVDFVIGASRHQQVRTKQGCRARREHAF